MIKVKNYNNTILVSFEECTKIDKEYSNKLKLTLFKGLKRPFTNIFIDFNEIIEVNSCLLDVLEAGGRLSRMNFGQLNLFNVKGNVLKSLNDAKKGNTLFFCDQPKPFSEKILMA